MDKDRMLDRVAWVLAGGGTAVEDMAQRATNALRVLRGVKAKLSGSDLTDRFVLSETVQGEWIWRRCKDQENALYEAHGRAQPSKEAAIQHAIEHGGLVPGAHEVTIGGPRWADGPAVPEPAVEAAEEVQVAPEEPATPLEWDASQRAFRATAGPR